MKKIYVKTYGCSLNHSDSEAIKGQLKNAGYKVTEKEEEADLIIINSCTVKSNPEQRLFHEIRTKKKPIIIAGCVPQADPENEHFKRVSVIGTKALSKTVTAVEETLKGKTVKYLGAEDEKRLELPTIPEKEFLRIIPINEGCLSHCSYCKTKQARGELKSYEPEMIEKNFREAINQGAKEIWLTSQDTGAYGLDIKTNIAELLERLLKKPGEHRIRLGMANPQHLIRIKEQLAAALKKENMFRFLHIPVQAGSNKVLRDMKRGYKKEMFEELVNYFKKEIPDITIATDIIVGFPTETEEDFEETIELIKKLRIPVVNLSKFYPRPGTEAAKMKLLPTNIVKQRSKKLKEICDQIAAERNKQQIGKEYEIIIDEKGKKPGTMIGRTDNYMQVIIPENKGRIGERIRVTIKDSGIFDLRA